MLIEERRQHILSLAQQHGRVLVEELSESLGISRITIRKDLDYLQLRGVLQRTHGGALLPQSGGLVRPVAQGEGGALFAGEAADRSRCRKPHSGGSVCAAGLRNDNNSNCQGVEENFPV